MDSDPFFPAPRPKGLGYREPARALEAGEGAQSSEQQEETTRKPIVVKRPDEAPRYVDGSRKASDQDSARELATNERIFATEHYAWSGSYPRLAGAVLAMVGVFLSLTRHGWRPTIFAPLLICWGVFLVIAGRPRDERGRTPTWWGIGAFIATVLGTIVSILVIAALNP